MACMPYTQGKYRVFFTKICGCCCRGSGDTEPKQTSDLREVTSRMVGTVYAGASPEAPPFVTVGQEVAEDTVICIMEAMKVMNEVKAECRGVIAEVVAENGKPVQFGQVLFKVR